MKRFLVAALATSVGLLSASVASAAQTGQADSNALNPGTYGIAGGSVGNYTDGMAANGIQASRHNIGSLGNFITVASGVSGSIDYKGKSGAAGGASEICVFCHTPHHTATNALNSVMNINTNIVNTSSYGPAPLWNRRGVENSYKAYGTTVGGSTNEAPGGVTLACLSCHDGITALDNLVNAPGQNGMGAERSGAGTAGYVAYPSDQVLTARTGSGDSQDAARAGWTFQDADGAAGGINSFQLGDELRLNIGQGNQVNGTSGDLSNDHPMSIVYSDGTGLDGSDTTKRASLRRRETFIGSIDLAAGLVFSTGGNGPALRDNLSQNRWALKGFIDDGATSTIEDLLRNGKVECSSCHDPHFKNLSNVDMTYSDTNEREGGTGVVWTINGGSEFGYNIGGNGGGAGDGVFFAYSDGLFLRRVGGNAGSGVCRTCHNK